MDVRRLPVGDCLQSGYRPNVLSVKDEVWCLNLDQIESHTGRVLSRVRVPVKQLGPSTHAFERGTVLYSKLRPYLNKVVVADEDGVATTELVPLRCDGAKVDANYLARFLRSAEFLSFATNVVSGAKMPRMVMSEFWKYPVPLPSLLAQRRIAAILNQADSLRAKRREVLTQLALLDRAVFFEMFGQYQHGEIAWPICQFSDLITDATIGLVRASDEFGPDFDVPYVRMNAIGQRGEFREKLVQKTNVTPIELARYQLRQGDLLFNTRNSRELVGKTTIFRGRDSHVYNNNIMRIRFNEKVDPEYVAASFQTSFLQQELEIRKVGTTSVFAIYGRDLKTLPMPLPPLATQKIFATRIQSIEALKTFHRDALAELDALFASLQYRAFSGQLS